MNGELFPPGEIPDNGAPPEAPARPAKEMPANGVVADDPQRALTAAQERFCLHLAEGLSAAQAYRAAFPNSGERAANVNASKLRRRPHILRRLRELNEDAQSQCLMRRARRLERLREIAESPDSNTRDVIAAIKTINDMAGDGDPPEAPRDNPDAGLLALLRRIRAGD